MLAVFVAVAGKVADLFGHRKIFILGLIVFGTASLFCGISQTSWQLIAFRGFQGLGTAMMLPSAQALLCEAFPVNQRGRAIGIFAAASSIGITLGPLLGGFFTHYLSWRYIFYVNIPIILITLVAALKYISKSPKVKAPIDFYGFVAFVFGISCLTLGIMQGNEWGWDSFPILSLIVFGILCLMMLYFIDKKVKHPFIDLSIIKMRPFLCVLLVVLMTGIARMMFVYWAIFFQKGLGFTPILTGALLMLSSVPMIFVSPYGGKIADKYGPRSPVIIGHIALIVSLIAMAFIAPMGSLIVLGGLLLIFGVGLILIMVPAYSAGLTSVPSSKRGAGAGILSTFRNSGLVLGVAVLGAVFFNAQFSRFSSQLAERKDTQALDPKLFEGLFSGVPKALNAIKTLPSALQSEIKTVLKASYDFGISISALIAALSVVIGLIVVLWFFKPNRTKEQAIDKKSKGVVQEL